MNCYNRNANTFLQYMTLEEYLHFKGYTTKGTSYHKIKANTGVAKAFVDLFYNNLKNGDVLKLQELVKEFNDN